MITKEQLEASFMLLKNDPHYYCQSPEAVEELGKEVDDLKDLVKALQGFYDSLYMRFSNEIAKKLAKRNNE